MRGVPVWSHAGMICTPLWHGLLTESPARPKVSFPASHERVQSPAMERYRIYPEAAVYFVTYSIVEWLPVFVTEAAFRIVAESLTFCHHNKHLRINAFVIMPTHMHMIVFDGDFANERLISTLADFRKFTG